MADERLQDVCGRESGPLQATQNEVATGLRIKGKDKRHGLFA